jgi:hypothetical protein
VYGDHLPWSFTGGVYSVAGGAATAQGNGSFSRLRTGADEYQTFFHVLGSHSQPRHVGFETVPPAWFLPTMVSSFLAGSVEDLYMPMNVYLFSRCGSDFLRSECATPEMAAAMRDALLNQDHLRVPDRRVPDRH